MPVLEKYGVTLPLECPLHNARDVFARQEEAKVHVPPQWTCGFCGKAFYHEAHLDRHLDNRHEEHLNNVGFKETMISFFFFISIFLFLVLFRIFSLFFVFYGSFFIHLLFLFTLTMTRFTLCITIFLAINPRTLRC